MFRCFTHIWIGISSYNTLLTFLDLSYNERSGILNGTSLERYVDSMSWAVGSMTGSSFSDVTPLTLNEILMSLVAFLTGTILLAKIFSDFASLKHLLRIEET